MKNKNILIIVAFLILVFGTLELVVTSLDDSNDKLVETCIEEAGDVIDDSKLNETASSSIMSKALWFKLNSIRETQKCLVEEGKFCNPRDRLFDNAAEERYIEADERFEAGYISLRNSIERLEECNEKDKDFSLVKWIIVILLVFFSFISTLINITPIHKGRKEEKSGK